jgi:endonuclease/exonuclease/phosphatase family metal-dependent hydrolase
MKIVFLNTWQGKLQDTITKFIREQSADTDIFCFQEFSDNMDGVTKDILSDYDEIFARKLLREEKYFLQATFVRKGFRRFSCGALLEKQAGCGLVVYVEMAFGGGSLYVCNVHGTAKPGEKSDTPERLKQSQVIIDFFKGRPGAIVIGGDFNLFPATKSVRIFEESGYRNLIKEYEIKTTRNHYAWDRYRGDPHYYSDYVFVSPEFLKVSDFSVPSVEISDHLPLLVSVEPKAN